MLNNFLRLANLHHTNFQMDYFITGKSGGTAYGCLFQCLRELQSRYQNIRHSWCSIARLVNQPRSEVRPTKLETISRIESDYSLQEAVDQLKHTQREFIRFYCQALSLWKYLFGDEYPSEETLTQLEEERWEHKVLADLALSLTSTGAVSSQCMAVLQSLPTTMRKRIISKTFGDSISPTEKQRAMGQLISWFIEYDPAIPPPVKLSEEESRHVLSCCVSPDLLPLLQNSCPMVVALLPANNMNNGSEYARLVKSESESNAASVDVS